VTRAPNRSSTPSLPARYPGGARSPPPFGVGVGGGAGPSFAVPPSRGEMRNADAEQPHHNPPPRHPPYQVSVLVGLDFWLFRIDNRCGGFRPSALARFLLCILSGRVHVLGALKNALNSGHVCVQVCSMGMGVLGYGESGVKSSKGEWKSSVMVLITRLKTG